MVVDVGGGETVGKCDPLLPGVAPVDDSQAI